MFFFFFFFKTDCSLEKHNACEIVWCCDVLHMFKCCQLSSVSHHFKLSKVSLLKTPMLQNVHKEMKIGSSEYLCLILRFNLGLMMCIFISEWIGAQPYLFNRQEQFSLVLAEAQICCVTCKNDPLWFCCIKQLCKFVKQVWLEMILFSNIFLTVVYYFF